MNVLQKYSSLKDAISRRGSRGAILADVFAEVLVSQQLCVAIVKKLSLESGWRFEKLNKLTMDLSTEARWDFSEIRAFAPPEEWWRAFGIQCKEDIPPMDSQFLTVLELLAIAGVRGMLVTEVGKALKCQKIHHIIDRFVAMGVVTKRMVIFELCLGANRSEAPKIAPRITILHLTRFAAQYIPEGDPRGEGFYECRFDLDDGMKFQIFEMLFAMLLEVQMDFIPASNMHRYLGISNLKKAMQCLREQVILYLSFLADSYCLSVIPFTFEKRQGKRNVSTDAIRINI